MKIETTLENIQGVVARIQKVSSKNLSLPVLENVLLTAKGKTCVARVTNLHVGVEVTLPVKVIEEGEIAVNLSVLGQITSSLSASGSVVLEVDGTTLNISTDHSDMQVKLAPHADFPTLPRVEEGTTITLPIETLIDGVKSVVYSASLSDIKPEISSVFIYNENNELVFVATDSFRLAERRVVVDTGAEVPGVIIPVKNMHECIKVFGGLTGDVSLMIGKNQLSIQSDSTYFTSRIIDGNYPEYQRIIPTKSTTEAVVLKDELVKALRLVNVFSDNFNQITLSVNQKSGTITMHSRNADIGENHTTVDAAVKGGDIEMHLNHKYLSDVLQSLATDSLQFSFVDKGKPCVIRGVGDPSFLYLIMPMNR